MPSEDFFFYIDLLRVFCIKLLFFMYWISILFIYFVSILYGLDSLQKISLVDPSSDVSVECGWILDTEHLTIQGFVTVVAVHLQTREVIVSQREHIHPTNPRLVKKRTHLFRLWLCPRFTSRPCTSSPLWGPWRQGWKKEWAPQGRRKATPPTPLLCALWPVKRQLRTGSHWGYHTPWRWNARSQWTCFLMAVTPNLNWSTSVWLVCSCFSKQNSPVSSKQN